MPTVDPRDAELAACPNPWCESHERPERGYTPFITSSRASFEMAVACPVCPMRGPWRDSNAEAIAAWNTRTRPPEPVAAIGVGEDFQDRVDAWMDVCFGAAIKADIQERSDRFIEEALEFVQAAGYSAERAHALVDYTFGRPQGEINQEVGGVMVTLAAMCNTLGVPINAAAEAELARIWTKVEQIRAKQAAKPTGSALPVARPAPAGDEVVEVVRDIAGETVCGFRVVAYRETHPEHGDRFGHTYSEHWSTPNTRHPNVKVERLFTEAQLLAALSAPRPDEGVVEREAEARRLYNEYTANHPTIHCNRFPSWSELSAEDRTEWLNHAALTTPEKRP